MANTSVFFPIWIGDDNTLEVTVVDDAGAIVDISSAQEITWKMAQDEWSSVDISKSLSGGWISMPGGGSDAIFHVVLSGIDTSSLDQGTYYQESTVKLSDQTTHVAVGTVWLRPRLI